jgi:hypothetical protein
MDQKSIVLYLHLKEMSAQTIHDDLVATLGYKTLGYSKIMKYLHRARFDPAKNPPDSDASSPDLDDSDKVILAALDENRSRQCGSLGEPPILHA